MSTDQEPTPSQKSELFNVPVLAGSDAGGLKALGFSPNRHQIRNKHVRCLVQVFFILCFFVLHSLE